MPLEHSTRSHQGTSVNLEEIVTERMLHLLDTSVKHVRKSDGRIENFDISLLVDSLDSALRRIQIRDTEKLRVLANAVVDGLDAHFDGEILPGTQDIKDMVVVTLIAQGYAPAARWYLLQRQRFNYPPHNKSGTDRGITVSRFFTKPDVHPYDEIAWERRNAVITNDKNEVVFEQKDVEVPDFWSQTATNIVVSKYFRGRIGEKDRETSAKELINRVATTIANWGHTQGYFKTEEDGQTFEQELTHILIHQYAAFNSPVWFNVGISEFPQCSACFINSVSDDMRSILNLAVTEGMLFKYGSGAGSNLSSLRSSKECLRGSSGKSSGPVSFMRGFDAFAGVIKSGGKTRRAAKMVILDVDHPDIMEFIQCKAHEEKKAWTLIDAGYDGTINGEAYSSIFFQNANNSVRVSDAFIQAYEDNAPWDLKAVSDEKILETVQSRAIMHSIAQAAWECGDPGMQYDTTINKWNPCINTARIRASNPCSEYMFLDDTACNLASINLMRCRTASGAFDVDCFRHVTDIIITAQEILVDNSSYPTPNIEQNSYNFRPLGIGYANLGALLMAQGVAYDSDEGRNIAGAITSLLSGEAYLQSSKIAAEIGAFNKFEENQDCFLRVMGMHRTHAHQLSSWGVANDLFEAGKTAWDDTYVYGEKNGYRNAQISVLAPTGTIAFLMDCDTTGIEPDIALVKYKWLVGGGLMKLVNSTVPEALTKLGYNEMQRHEILAFIDTHDTIEGAPHLKEEHLPVFDCAFKPAQGVRSIHYLGHVRMMAAAQPFISGAISKTVNMPQSTTVQEIMDTYVLAAKAGLKAIAIYRDGCKRSQPLTTSKHSDMAKSREQKLDVKDQKDENKDATSMNIVQPSNSLFQISDSQNPISAPWSQQRRRRLSDERRSITHKFSVGHHEGYITVGLYDDGAPGEIFIQMSKEGSVISGLMDSFATAISIGLQYGVPLKVLVNKFAHMRFEPSGYTKNPQIRFAKSVVDYIFRYLGTKFLSADDQRAIGIHMEEIKENSENGLGLSVTMPDAVQHTSNESVQETALPLVSESMFSMPSNALKTLTTTFNNTEDAPVCDNCGAIMVRYAACYRCVNCGGTTGCS